MTHLTSALRVLRDAISPLASRVAPVQWKELNELVYWKEAKRSEGSLSHSHYEYMYTTYFGIELSFYEGKVILDLGCGPRGSLEWADVAKRRIGLDPLADRYMALGAREHKMEYMNAPSEHIPLGDGYCDVVTSFNSRDHVEDDEATLKEIKRVTKPGGLFLLLVEVNHPPTACEPHNLRPAWLLDALKPEFQCELVTYSTRSESGIYNSVKTGAPLTEDNLTDINCYMSAKCLRR